MRTFLRSVVSAIAHLCKPAPAQNLEDFGDAMSDFYLDPTEQAFRKFQSDADQLRSQLEGDGNGADLLVAVMIARISAKYRWPISDGAFGVRAKELLNGQSVLAKYISNDTQVDPTKLDVWWASYYATGEDRYLENIFQYAGIELPKGDVGRMQVVGAATWSFKANCRQHKAVLASAKKRLDDSSLSDAHANFLKECIAGA